MGAHLTGTVAWAPQTSSSPFSETLEDYLKYLLVTVVNSQMSIFCQLSDVHWCIPVLTELTLECLTEFQLIHCSNKNQWMQTDNRTRCTLEAGFEKRKEKQTKTMLNRPLKWGHNITWTNTEGHTGLNERPGTVEVIYSYPSTGVRNWWCIYDAIIPGEFQAKVQTNPELRKGWSLVDDRLCRRGNRNNRWRWMNRVRWG